MAWGFHALVSVWSKFCVCVVGNGRSFYVQVNGRSRKRGRPRRAWMEVAKIGLKCNLDSSKEVQST